MTRDQFPPSDDDLVARLRRVTADVPPSTLDLDAVLRSSRRGAVRHRAAVAAGCVAAVGIVGAGVPQIAEMLPDGGGSVASAAATPSAPAETCDPADVEVTWRDETAKTVILRVQRVTYDEKGDDEAGVVTASVDEPIPYDQAAAALAVRGPGVDAAVRAGVLRAASEVSGRQPRDVPKDRSGFSRSWDDMLRNEGVSPRSPGMLEGLDAAGKTPDAPGPGALTEVEGPGTYLIYAAGKKHTAQGTAECGGETSYYFTLTYRSPRAAGTLRCDAPADDSLSVHVKRAFCETALTPAERDLIGLDPEQPASVETADQVGEQFGLYPDGYAAEQRLRRTAQDSLDDASTDGPQG